MNIPSRPPRLLAERRAWVLLHPTALLGFAGDGTRGAIGESARRFVDWLAEGGFSVWQVLPLGPPGAGGSPYGARSDVAGQVALIDRAELPDPTAERDDYRAFVEASRDWLEDYVLFETLADHHRCAWWDWPQALARHESEALARFASERAEELERRRIEQWWFDWQWRSLRRHAAARGVHLFGDLPIYVAADSTAVWAQREQFQLDASGR